MSHLRLSCTYLLSYLLPLSPSSSPTLLVFPALLFSYFVSALPVATRSFSFLLFPSTLSFFSFPFSPISFFCLCFPLVVFYALVISPFFVYFTFFLSCSLPFPSTVSVVVFFTILSPLSFFPFSSVRHFRFPFYFIHFLPVPFLVIFSSFSFTHFRFPYARFGFTLVGVLCRAELRALLCLSVLQFIIVDHVILCFMLVLANNTHTHPFNGPLSRTTRVSRYQKGKTVWILLKQETVSGSGISWAICQSAPRYRQITTPAPHHSVFYRPDALPATQPAASKHCVGK